MKYRKRFDLIEWQMYWRDWWRIWPWYKSYPADEYSPCQIYFGIGPLQVRGYWW